MDASSDQNVRISLSKASQLRTRYPDKYPVIIESIGSGIEVERRKYLASSSSTMGELMFSIRKYVSLRDHEAMFIYVNSTLVPTSALVSEIWNSHKEDECLYIEIHKENTFGR